MDKAKGAQGKIQEHTGGSTTRPPDKTKTLSEMGVSKDQSSKWQKLAAVPEAEFEAAINETGVKPSAKNTNSSKQDYNQV